ncbi:MAG: NAD-dependent epimerase/dehydratase family protein [Nannocystaceae bacterium]|nr:NAD-dependent epimerase/dehydratase family protein [Nannocystaceae bacterium]
MSARTKSILLTGGRSLLGMHVAAQAGRIRRISRDPSFGADVTGDLRNNADAQRAMQGCDTVIHVAMRGPNTSAAQTPVLTETENLQTTRAVLRAALRSQVSRVVVGVPTTPRPNDRLLSTIADARVQGLDVRVLHHPTPVGRLDIGPSWFGRAMLRFAAGGIRTFVPGSLALIPAAQVASALVRVAHEDLSANSDRSLPGESLDVHEVLELWADGFGPRSRPWSRPGVLRSLGRRVATPWMRRLLSDDFDPREAGPNPPRTDIYPTLSVEHPSSVADAVEESISWFAEHGRVRLAREQHLAS